MKKLFPQVLLLCFVLNSIYNYSQERRFSIHTIAFYNLENLFDTEDDPFKFDESSPIMEIASERQLVYSEKIKNMAKVIDDIGKETTKTAPTIIGISEIENRKVLNVLTNDMLLRESNYGIVHFDSPDSRGIDVALLYKKQFFKIKSAKPYPVQLIDKESGKRIYTRDELLVSGFLDGDLIHIIVNHWPSRRGGEDLSNYKREAAATLNKTIIDSLQTANPYAKIILMGDLNDNPTDSSLKTILNTKRDKQKLNLKDIYNPMENLYLVGLGTTAYRDKWSLFDQIMVSKSLLKSDYKTYQFYKAGIFNPDYLITKTGPYKGYPFRSFDNGGFTGGYSDHFPVYMFLIKEQL
ncbi:endonuclease/exonuclease/phosphatase family protein [Formosa sp. S-31]|uniref:endonuclease/exonuclease/phosphatase family protein n=1 Tax=Formosa sp. S-31 TaxID=2790949 RepID=UPI003EBF662E